jgi:hypothetical protein
MKDRDSGGSPASEYLTRGLSKKTWPDFERLFGTHPAPGAYPCWCMHNHLSGRETKGNGESRASRVEKNRQRKKALVEGGCSHGILVYAQGEPVGWCQYGLRNELPRIDSNPKYRKLTPANHGKRLWRIACFVVHRKYRRCGVASTALKAALAAIQRRAEVWLKRIQFGVGVPTRSTEEQFRCSKGKGLGLLPLLGRAMC